MSEQRLKEGFNHKKVGRYSYSQTGILHPIMMNRWKIIFDSMSVSDNVGVLTAQAVRCNFDFVESMLYVEFDQSTGGDEHIELANLAKRSFSVRVDCLDGNFEVYHALAAFHCTMQEHKFELDYAESGVAMHKIKIKIGSLQILVPEKKKPLE